MLGYRMYNSGNDGFYIYVLLLILLRRLDPRDSAWESQTNERLSAAQFLVNLAFIINNRLHVRNSC